MPYQVEMAQATREKLSPKDFVFPKEKKWPIQDVEQAKIALTWATWPQHKKVAKQVRNAVFKKYPQLKRKKKMKSESLGTLGSVDTFRGRLESLKSMLGEQGAPENDPDSVAAQFNKENETDVPKPLMERPEDIEEALGSAKFSAREMNQFVNNVADDARRIQSNVQAAVSSGDVDSRFPGGVNAIARIAFALSPVLSAMNSVSYAMANPGKKPMLRVSMKSHGQKISHAASVLNKLAKTLDDPGKWERKLLPR